MEEGRSHSHESLEQTLLKRVDHIHMIYTAKKMIREKFWGTRKSEKQRRRKKKKKKKEVFPPSYIKKKIFF